ncbi:polyketide biosynthesis acyl carrier protein [Streptomyces canus]|uniref:Polyketide biosynthesis acyl carrier protein n=1 Tax=Streptomyces canus TaxID=58343 RepID=A0AAW8FTU5_9ACTN|nr:phosphopantetheine-binding protein [Streptomyces canus]MDQ0912431.1 polyketide biosynthesis acyl carrier protein [Streptomyces canus]
MDETTAFEAVRSSTLEVLPGLDPAAVTLDGSLSDLGANSIDRTEITTLAMERLDITVPVTEFHAVRNIASLVELLRKYG